MKYHVYYAPGYNRQDINKIASFKARGDAWLFCDHQHALMAGDGKKHYIALYHGKKIIKAWEV